MAATDTHPFNDAEMFNAAWLMGQTFAPLKYVIPGVIPEGMTLLVAPPKVGKSWLVLDLAYQLATGGLGLGKIRLDAARPVLYLALEDGPRRLQDRLKKLEVTTGPSRLFFSTDVPRDQVLERCQNFVNENPQQPVIILDTLGKVAPPAQTGESDYQRDYRIGGDLKAIADSVPGAAVIVVHHTRKAVSDDFLDSVSGTQGLAGSADSIILLRRPRNETHGTLSVTSRDAMEGEYALELVDGRWILQGENLGEAAAVAQLARVSDGVGDRMFDVIAAVGRNPEGIKPKDVAILCGMSPDETGKYLRRAADAGRVERAARGLYIPVRSVRLSETGSPFGHTDTSDTHSEELEVVA